jgi:hypothetical protein
MLHLLRIRFVAPAVLIAVTIAVGGSVRPAHAQTTGCYTYQSLSGSTVSVNLTTSAGMTSTITIPNQNPPSILQEMDFYGNEDCAFSYFSDDSLGLNFLTNSGTFSFTGYPEPMSDDDSYVSANYPSDYSDWISGDFSLWIGSFAYHGLNDIPNAADEDAIINTISSTGQFSMQSTVIDPYDEPLAQNMSVSATNCVALSGSGPRKIVFMRGISLDPTIGSPTSVSDFLAEVNATLGILKSVDPYKTYWSQFSFYIDLKKVKDTNLPIIGYTGGGAAGVANGVSSGYMYNADPTGNVFTSSCANGSSEIDVVIINEPGMFIAWTSQFGKTIFVNDQSYSSSAGSIAMPLARQLAKSIGGLNSENVVAPTGDLDTSFTLAGDTLTEWSTNCSINPGDDYRGPDGYIYGSTDDKGCKYLNGTAASHPPHYYRPSNESIMSDLPSTLPIKPDGGDDSKFNVISCGYIVAGLLGQTVNQTNASSHWKECLGLDTAGKDEIASETSAPTIDEVTQVDSAQNTFAVSGSGLSSTNFVRLTPATSALAPSSVLPANSISALDSLINFFKSIVPFAHGQTTGAYEIDGVTSSDGSTATFTVPGNVPDGTYTVSVSGANSPWANTGQTITVTGNGSGDPTTAIGAISGSGSGGSGSSTGTGSGTGSSSSTGSGGTLVTISDPSRTACSAGYTMLNASSTAIVCDMIIAPTTPSGVLPTTIPSTEVGTESGYYYWLCPPGYSKVQGNGVNVYTCVPNLTPSGLAVSFLGNGANGKTIGYISIAWSNPTYALTANNILVEASSNGGPYSVIATLSGSATSYNDSGIPAGTNRTYRIRVLFSNGAYGPYTSVNATIPSVNIYPAPVPGHIGDSTGYVYTGGISTSPGLVYPTFSTPFTVVNKFSFSGAVSDLSPWSSVSASIERSTSSSTGFVQVALDTSSQVMTVPTFLDSTSVTYYFTVTPWGYLDTTVSPGVTYYYRARFVFPNGDYGPYSAIESITSSVPTPAVLKISTKAETSLGLSWTWKKKVDTGNPSFTVMSASSSVPLETFASTTSSYTVSNLTPSTQYCYVVNLVYNPVNVTPSAMVCAATTKATAPSSLSAKASGQIIALKWSATDLTGNTSVERSTSKASGFVQISTATSTSYIDSSSLVPATTYYYRVRKIYSDGSFSPYSNVASVKTGAVATATKTTVVTSDVVTQDATAVDTTESSTTVQSPVVSSPSPIETPTPIPATATYSCSTSGYVLSGTSCTLTATVPAVTKKGCPTGYTILNQTCVRAVPLSIIPQTNAYSCPSGYALNGTTCSASSVTVPATARYSCPSGYILDASSDTCSSVTSAAFATSTTTATVFNSITDWFNWMWGW